MKEVRTSYVGGVNRKRRSKKKTKTKQFIDNSFSRNYENYENTIERRSVCFILFHVTVLAFRCLPVRQSANELKYLMNNSLSGNDSVQWQPRWQRTLSTIIVFIAYLHNSNAPSKWIVIIIIRHWHTHTAAAQSARLSMLNVVVVIRCAQVFSNDTRAVAPDEFCILNEMEREMRIVRTRNGKTHIPTSSTTTIVC